MDVGSRSYEGMQEAGRSVVTHIAYMEQVKFYSKFSQYSKIERARNQLAMFLRPFLSNNAVSSGTLLIDSFMVDRSSSAC